MLLKIARCIGVSFAGMALANVALAQETNVTTLAKSSKLGGEFRSELNYQNNGLTKAKGYTPKASTDIEVQALNIKLSGNINADTEYNFRFNLLNPNPTTPNGGPVEYGYATHWFNPMFGFSIGKERVLQGGWDNINNDYRSHANGVYQDNLVFSEYEPMAALHVKAAGQVTLQILNDLVMAPAGTTAAEATGHPSASWNKTEHPTWVLGWAGEFGPIMPLIDFGSFDNNKSRWIDVGLKTAVNGLTGTLDFYNQNVVGRAPDAAGKLKDATSTATAITLNVAYEVKDVVTPWVYFSTFTRKQADDKKLGLKDAKFNSAPADAKDAGSYVFDDNGIDYGIGVDVNSMGKGWTPYVAIVSRAGKFEDPTKPGETETKSGLAVRVGVLGEI